MEIALRYEDVPQHLRQPTSSTRTPSRRREHGANRRPSWRSATNARATPATSTLQRCAAPTAAPSSPTMGARVGTATSSTTSSPVSRPPCVSDLLYATPNINSYKRFPTRQLRPDRDRPCRQRCTCALRVVDTTAWPAGGEPGCPAAMVNPASRKGGDARGGRYQDTRGLALEPRFDGNAYASDKARVPTTLVEARERCSAGPPWRGRRSGTRLSSITPTRPRWRSTPSTGAAYRLGRSHPWDRKARSAPREHHTEHDKAEHARGHQPVDRNRIVATVPSLSVEDWMPRSRVAEAARRRAVSLAADRRLLRFSEVVDAHIDELAQLEVTGFRHTIGNARWRWATSATCSPTTCRTRAVVRQADPRRRRSGRPPSSRSPSASSVIVPWNFPMPIAAKPSPGARRRQRRRPQARRAYPAFHGHPPGGVALRRGCPEGVHRPARQGINWCRRTVRHPPGRARRLLHRLDRGRPADQEVARRADQAGHPELGGKSANIAFADSDLEKAAASVPDVDAFDNPQDCCARSRILVQAEGL